jgi:hypothetical protein
MNAQEQLVMLHEIVRAGFVVSMIALALVLAALWLRSRR